MSKSRIWLPVLAGAAAVGVGALAFVYARRGRGFGQGDQPGEVPPPARALRDSMVVPRGHARDRHEELDLDGIFSGESEEPEAGPTVQSAVRVPPLVSADDAEPPSPDELGSYWLSRAAQSEHSPSEGELVLDFEDLAIAEPADQEELDEGDRLSAEAWRG